MSSSVLYISPALPVGGLEKLIVRISSVFSDERNRKQFVVSLSENNPIAPEFDKSITIHALQRRSKFDLKPLKDLRRLIKTEKPEVAICLNFFSFLFIYLSSLGLKQKPRIVVFYQTTLHLNKKEHNLHKFYLSLLSKRDMVIAASKNQVKYTSDTYGVSNKIFHIIYNGVNINHFTVMPAGWDRNAFRAEKNIPPNAKTIVMAAALRPEKNHLGAVKALTILHEKYNIKAHLLIAGGGIMEKPIQEEVNRLNMQTYVSLAGMQKDVRPVFWASDLFTLCSTSVETFSVAALEAMACGLPCVLTNIGGANEMIVEGKTGHVCETSSEDIAAAWAKTLSETYLATDIHHYIETNFSETMMMDEYRKIL